MALTIALLVAVAASGIAAAFMTGIQSRREVQEWTDREAAVVESVVQDVLGDMFTDLEATAAYVAMANPSPAEFAVFVDQIGGSENALGIGYAIEVSIAEADTHVAQMRAQIGDFYDLYGIDPESGLSIPVDRTGRQRFYPVQMFSLGREIIGFTEVSPDGKPLNLGEMGLGIDAGFDNVWREYIEAAMAAEGRSLSPFTSLEAGVAQIDRIFFASVPIRPSDGRPNGVVAALLVEPLLLGNLDRKALEDVAWEVVPPGGNPERIDSDHIRLYEMDLPGNPWQLAVAPTDDAVAAMAGVLPWQSGMVAAAVAAIAAGLLWLLIERRAQTARSARMRVLGEEKDRFLATVSHELRTPLTVVAGFAEEIRDRSSEFEPDELAGILDLIVEETDELTAIVEDLLVAARSDISSVRVIQQPVALLGEARNAVDALGIRATVTGDDIDALADPQRVRQILRNLLTNAQRYGGSEIRVDVMRANVDNATLVVSDSGKGISPTKRDLIFQPYESAHSFGTETGAVGLGLYISRALAEAMGGELIYSHDGSWSKFSLALLAADCPLPGRTPERARASAGST